MSQSSFNSTTSSFLDHIFCLKSRRSKDFAFSKLHRWSIYIIGVLETFIFSGCIFGWGPLVYVLKNEDIFLDSCTEYMESNSSHNWNISDIAFERNKFVGCEDQDKKFALIFAITTFVYSIPSVLCGFILHHWGLVISRISGSLLVILGFIALGSTTREESYWLYLAMTSLALGASQLRISAYQFCDLFPKYRSTALTIISGSYAASAGLFILFQIGQQNGLSLWTMTHFLTAFGIFSFVVTIIMPWHHVPYGNVSHELQKQSIPLTQSMISLSSFLHIFHLMFNVSSLIFYSINFNQWISGISKTNEEAGHFTMIYSIFSFACLFGTPLPGILFDFLMKRAAKASTPEDRLLQELKCPTLPLLIVTLLSVALQMCFFFNSASSVYVSLVILMIVRPSVLSVGYAAIRIRFPAEHFDRLVGIYSTIISCVFIFQYPFFISVQSNFVLSMSCFITILLLTAVYPLHYLSLKYRKKIAKEKMENFSKEQHFVVKDNNN